MQHPYLTIVLTSRNDDYAGGMLPRLQICIDSFLEQAERHHLELELILVDWNPPSDSPPLKDALTWPKSSCYTTVRVIDVPQELHQQLPLANKLPFLAHAARNVGIRRAKGKFVLVTATDILFSEQLIVYLASKPLQEDKNYRVSRHDVPDEVIEIATLEDRLNFCENNVGRIYGRPEQGVYGFPLLHTFACGDFVLLSKRNYFKLNGIPEERQYHSFHFDTVFCYMMYASEIQEVILNDPHRIYHMDHESNSIPSTFWLQPKIQGLSFLSKRRRNQLSWLVGKLTGQTNSLDRLGVPYITKYGSRTLKRTLANLVQKKAPIAYNDESWGLGRHILPEATVVRPQWKEPLMLQSENGV
ncbi:MAG: glycosyltransferase family A protein [Chloroflexota bacterium]